MWRVEAPAAPGRWPTPAPRRRPTSAPGRWSGPGRFKRSRQNEGGSKDGRSAGLAWGVIVVVHSSNCLVVFTSENKPMCMSLSPFDTKAYSPRS